MLATSLAVRGIPLNTSLQEDITLPLTGLGTSFSGSAVEFDGNEEAIFYNDRSKGLVYKSNLNGTGELLLCLCSEAPASFIATKVMITTLHFVFQSSVTNPYIDFLYALSVRQILTGYRVGIIDAMAYDWTSSVLFWTTSTYNSVAAFRVTDKSRRDIVTGLRNPKGIAVHPSAG